MELLQLRYFLDVAQTQHVTRSAERLHVAQPAVTQAIRRLEEELGVPLFIRQGRGVVLSEYGRYFQKRLLPLMEGMEKLPEEMHTMANLENATIHLNVLAASSLVTDAIARYVHIADQLNFRMTQTAESQLYDIQVSSHPAYPAPGEGEFVCSENIFMAVPAQGRYAYMDSVCLADLKEEGFISLQGTSQLRMICDAFCRRVGFTPHVIFESDNPGAVRNMIAANMGVGFWPEFTWGKIDTDRVRLLRIDDLPCRRDILITRKNNKADNTEVERFFHFLTDYFQQRRGNVHV